MSALAVWTYPDAAGARRLERSLRDGALGDVSVTDGAVVTWTRGRASAQVRELQGVARTCNLGSSFWGMLFGIVVSGPELSSIAGAEQRVLDESLGGVGVSRETLVALRGRLQPGGSALAVICSEAVVSAIQAVGADTAGDGSAATANLSSTTRLLAANEEYALRRIFAS